LERKYLHFLVIALLLSLVLTLPAAAAPSNPAGLVLGKGSLFNDDFANLNNWDFPNGASATVSKGVVSVIVSGGEGIAMKIKDAVWEKMGKPTSYYVEMLIKPTSLPTGNKNIGIATNISSDNSKWYYAGFNSNGRMQAGTSDNLKGYQNSNDKLKFSKAEDLVYFKWRIENDNGVINFYCNDLYMGKSTGDGYLGKALANYAPGSGYTGSFGIYSCGASFEIAAVRVGKLNENQTKLVLETTDASFPLLWAKFLQRIDNVSATGIRVGEQAEFKVYAFNAKNEADRWTVKSSNPKVLAVSPANGASGSSFTVKAVGTGTATIEVQNVSNPNSRRTITYNVSEALGYVKDSYSGIDNKVLPAIGETAAYTDGELAVTFDGPPSIADDTGLIQIHNYATGEVVDAIRLKGDTSFVPERNSAMNYGSQRVRIEGNTLYIAPHSGVLAYQTKYFVSIPNGVIKGQLGGKPFTGFSPESKTWSFTTKAAPAVSGKTITVNGNPASKAHFRTVQAALAYVAANDLDGMTIEIAPGIYREILNFKKDLNVTLKGMGKAPLGSDVVIEYKNGERANGGTVLRALAYISTSKTITLANLTIKNAADKGTYGQAEALYFDSPFGYLVAKNCSFLGDQDTLQTKGYNWFKDCYVEGSTDFIWGSAIVSLFENCKIKCISPGSIIAHARCLPTSKGYVFLNCELEAVAGASFFARDMAGTESNYDNVAFVNCTIKGEGTLTWNDSYPPTPVNVPASALTGWKYYNLKNADGKPYEFSSQYDYELTQAEYEEGFASRTVILGKPTSDGKTWVNTNAWNPEEP